MRGPEAVPVVATEAAAAVGMELAAALARPAQTGSRSATEAAAAVGMELAAREYEGVGSRALECRSSQPTHAPPRRSLVLARTCCHCLCKSARMALMWLLPSSDLL